MKTTLNARCESGSLVHWEPTLPNESTLRTLFVSTEIWEEIYGDVWLDGGKSVRYAQLVADLDRFVVGDLIQVGMSPYDKGANSYLARIDPVELGIWTMRSCAPQPAIRVFGAFCERDCFIALLTRQRTSLNGPNSREWANAREAALVRWSELFPGKKCLLGDQIHDFISEKTLAV